MAVSVFGRIAGVVLLGLDFVVASSAMAGDAVKGEKVFKKCQVCHYVRQGKEQDRSASCRGVRACRRQS